MDFCLDFFYFEGGHVFCQHVFVQRNFPQLYTPWSSTACFPWKPWWEVGKTIRFFCPIWIPATFCPFGELLVDGTNLSMWTTHPKFGWLHVKQLEDTWTFIRISCKMNIHQFRMLPKEEYTPPDFFCSDHSRHVGHPKMMVKKARKESARKMPRKNLGVGMIVICDWLFEVSLHVGNWLWNDWLV